MIRQRYLNDQRGVVGLVILALVLVITVGAAAFYVYNVRTGKSEPVTASSSAKQAATVPKEVKADPDAAAAEQEGAAADQEDLSDLDVSASDLQ